MFRFITKTVAGATACSAMERETISKNRVSQKNDRSRGNFRNSLFIVTAMCLITACGVIQSSKTDITYEEVHKKSVEPYKVSYDLPVITPTNGTKQTQTKGGVTITCEVVPFTVSMKDRENKNPWYKDPKFPDQDCFEIFHTPVPEISPDRFVLNIKIKNKQERILKVRETALLLQIDGVTYNIPQEMTEQWHAGMIIKNGEFNYVINGPELNSLYDAKLVYLFINDVPTKMDDGGNIKKRENFEWYFECKKETVNKEAQITYAYETSPIETRQCVRCNGFGQIKGDITRCSSCGGTGNTSNKDKEGRIITSRCSKCGGSGRVQPSYRCSECSGKGILSFPKSLLPKEVSRVTWNWWEVNVKTIPDGATVKHFSTSTKQYETVKYPTPCYANYVYTFRENYPIIVEYNGQSVKVSPYKSNGKKSDKITVDFSSGTPIVTTEKQKAK